MKTLYWHDYESWGTDPARDKPSQFAGVRTDENLNIIGEPLMIYCQPAADTLPHPMACLITGITPQKALAEGVSEAEFTRLIHNELSQPGTCGVGYNSLRFDDNVSRNLFYRNFYDAYEREWKNGNSRWDILDMVRLTYALRPEGIEWPRKEDGSPSFKLEQLTVANGLIHDAAHDALSDVYATIDMAKLIREKQPKLYEYAYQLRTKRAVQDKLNVTERKPFLHVSGKLPSNQGCTTLMMPLCWHPTNKNEVIAFDLQYNPEPLRQLDADTLREKLYTPSSELAEGEQRIGLKNIRINMCPVIAPTTMLDAKAAQRLNIDKSFCEKHWQRIREWDLTSKMQQVFSDNRKFEALDVETQLFSGFFGDDDKLAMGRIRQAGEEGVGNQGFSFVDQRLPELLLRYKARNFPKTLTEEESLQWQEFCYQKLTEPEEGYLGLEVFFEEIDKLDTEYSGQPDKLKILSALREYGDLLLA